MQRLRLIALLGGPSIASGVITGLLTVLLLGIANYSYLLRSGLLYDLIFGKGTPYDLIQSSKDSASIINEVVLGNPLLNKILFFGFWVMIGLAVYAVIAVFSQSVGEIEDELEQLQYRHASRDKIRQDIFLRLAIRACGLLALFIYGWLFIRVLFPFCVYASRIGLSNLSQISNILYVLLSVIILAIALHIVVIIFRLIVLRPRIFGEWDNLG